MSEKRPTPRIKVCGITSPADAMVVAGLGVDALGLVFFAPSPRCVSISQATAIARTVGPFMTIVGLFVNASEEEIANVLRQVPLHVLQFHGDENAAFCQQFGRPWIKALRVKENMDIQAACREFESSDAVLLDSYKTGVPGGTGETFDWTLINKDAFVKARALPMILAGGLNPDNVQHAIREVSPYAVDVSGGVESSPGKKDPQKLKAFVDAVRNLQ